MNRAQSETHALAGTSWRPMPILSWLAILGCALLTVFSVAKGFAYGISPDVHLYYVINYHDGLVRRGLIGHLLSWIVDQSKLADTLAVAANVYLATNIAVLVLLFAWTASIELRRRDLLAASLYALYAASQFIPTVSYNVGFLDAYDYLLLVLAAIALVKNRLWLAVAIGGAGPFVHDAFVFTWICPAIVALWLRPNLWTGLALSAPLVTTAIVYFVPTSEAAIAQMQAAPLPDDVKAFSIAYQFGQTFLSSLYIVLWKIGHNISNVLIAVAYFTLPAVLLVVLYGRARGDRRAWIALGLATFFPLSINLVGWDLTRFLAPAPFFALLAILFAESLDPTGPPGRFLSPGCWLAALVLVQAPFIYGYAEVVGVMDRTIVRDWPIGRLVESGARYFSRKIRPKVEVVTAQGNPPGNVWYMEEDAWSGALVRRPGTNIFDATMTKGGQVVQYTAEIVRDGDQIFITRDPHDRQARMTYVGRLRGNRVTGTYSGGVWGAIILR
ncbi:MAG: hypothetical protein AB7F22_31690 [Reyranella sp.]|uniref:hypothetical protein n=1 Tax=Reyranella sp. TaxID=1929291 RepID=UPI003D133E04